MRDTQNTPQQIIVRWSDEGHWAHVFLDVGTSRQFLGFVPLEDPELHAELEDHGELGDDAMWQAQLRLPHRAGAAA